MAENTFKAALARGETLCGLWLALADPYSAEVCAGAGFDWLLIDGEHAPNDLRSTLASLQALAAYPVVPLVRPPVGDTVGIKRLLDIGARNILIPMVETPEQARELVAATRYPPRGVRGVGAALARASGFGRDAAYLSHADDGVCLLLQIESVAGLAALDEIAAVDGVDGVFIGPADLAASFGQLGQPGHADVQQAIQDAARRIRAAGKAAGILSTDEAQARVYLDWGYTFVAVGTDVTLLARATSGLAARFRTD
ncbi:2,4-dihydroxyhept-2-ene-1,7-dioic acid aldolase [Deinococcus aerolatus]|uniref:2,4-dihydroxyhept-2-ene-1,7-dioic acid aldolase n=1 Tax=Deinococcus aerolatus TaxID=522487 RepID=A0ABQ2GCW1_9DEIO|nr:4-hydroxy-2-oxoheptanedioate aldolase [Deinococcus aerolatus]GGL87460.1 2,4-dihydroxyhept-2-ene-1,7-dioic acid aldolase [Deinococcus aerolatus]